MVQGQIKERGVPSSGPDTTPVETPSSERSCLVCRAPRETSELLRVTVLQGRLVFDRAKKRGPGRGAHVCLESACLGGLDENRLSRAFRTSQSLAEPLEESLTRLKEIANRRIFESLGLARRSGKVELGTDRVAENLKKCMDGGRLGVALRATDLAVKTVNRLSDAWPVGTAEELGRAIGVGKAGAVWVPASRFASALKFWLQVKRAASVEKLPDTTSYGSKKGKS